MQVAISSFFQKSLKVLTFIYCILMFTFFLFYVENAYFNITAAKYHCFMWLTVGYAVSGIICGSVYLFFHSSPWNLIKNFVKSLSITDWGMLILLLSNITTTLLSDDPAASFNGSWGRSMGLNFTVLICIMYFFVSRTLSHMRFLLHLFLGSCFIVGILGLLNALGYDPFQWFVSIHPSQIHWYLSTIGNITFFAHLFCLSLPIAVGLFLNAKQHKKAIGYAAWIWLGFTAVLISNIDGAYLGVAAFMLYYFWQNCTSYQKLQQFLIVILIGLCSVILLSMAACSCDYLSFNGISKWLIHSFTVRIMIVFIILVMIMMRLFPNQAKMLPYRKIRNIIFALIGLVFVLLLTAVIYFTWIHPDISLNDYENYLRFNDSWGHERGFLWQKLFHHYVHFFTVPQWLFGKGLDSTRILMAEITGYPISAVYYDNAHNEYLQYLVTSGLCGLLAYLSVWGTLLVRLYRRKELPYFNTLIAVFLAHSAQAITGLNQPITTPLLFLLFAIAEGMLRKCKNNRSST